MINTWIEHISSTHSFGMHRFSLNMDWCINYAEDQSAPAEALAGNLK